MEARTKGETNINQMPRGNNVIIKITGISSIMEINTGKFSEETLSSKADFEIAAIGELVPNDLKLGDKVGVSITQAYHRIDVTDNKDSIKEIKKTLDSMKPSEINILTRDKEKSKCTVIEYGLFPEYLVKTILK